MSTVVKIDSNLLSDVSCYVWHSLLLHVSFDVHVMTMVSRTCIGGLRSNGVFPSSPPTLSFGYAKHDRNCRSVEYNTRSHISSFLAVRNRPILAAGHGGTRRVRAICIPPSLWQPVFISRWQTRIDNYSTTTTTLVLQCAYTTVRSASNTNARQDPSAMIARTQN